MLQASQDIEAHVPPTNSHTHAVVPADQEYAHRLCEVSRQLRRELRRGPLSDWDQEDALQDVLLKLWKRRRKFRKYKHLLLVARRALKNRSIDSHRKALRSASLTSRLDTEAFAVGSAHEGNVAASPAVRDLHRVISGLPPLQRLIVLADLGVSSKFGDIGADATQLARQWRTTANSIYVSRHKARETIRKHLMALGHFTRQAG